ncbi:hypothetical protein Poli38472_002547 [Pythium oligandrum]|uniref:Mevalonate kinase n=1 Tax=Pythium oligandrum TaxID=41045 RepID=A0A8K1CHE6_PYTOL|nr:hypothetical protein Poli38472_002547 [Pythium oligandrum]|eukprot:TMW63606.1 hypothetical protein Poli38472_002547 [Pythium oligandrum]
MEMMTVRASAPAKVLLFGEHAVVYGCPSIAVALTDLRLSVAVERVATDAVASIELVFEDLLLKPDEEVALQRKYEVRVLQEIVTAYRQDASYLPTPDPKVLQRIEDLVKHEEEDVAKPLRPCLYLCCAFLRSSPILSGSSGSLRIRVSAKRFPIGAGLGSSAALCVALAGALTQFIPSTKLTLEQINEYAFSAEVILHGSPSGVDNTVSSYGGALQFRKLPNPSFTRLDIDLSSFRFLVVNTRVPRSTKVLVGNVRTLYDANPAETQQVFDDIEAIIGEFVQLSKQGELSETALGQLMEKNHTLLNAIGVGHPQIEKVVEICKPHGIWTKLTGAGGGGCTVSLVPRSLDIDTLDALVQQLETHGFQCFLSSVGGAGFVNESSTIN